MVPVAHEPSSRSSPNRRPAPKSTHLADMYGGHYTTMSMLVSSCHPRGGVHVRQASQKGGLLTPHDIGNPNCDLPGSAWIRARKKKLGSSDTRSQKDIPITEFFNTHRRLHQQSGSMHYERAPHLGGQSWGCGAASAPLRCVGLRSATAASE